jgi:polyribonucleotide nucleotidyltransferase
MANFSITELSHGPFTLQHGRIARQSDGSVLGTFGDTIVLATANRQEPYEPLDFFPLSVDFEEKFYAGGKIPGGFFKREGKPSEDAVLSARMIDRPIRPLFPKSYADRLHLVITVLSADRDHAPDIIGTLAASMALMISSTPFEGPIAAARVGLVDGELVLNPNGDQLAESEMDIVIAGTADAVTMIEGEMNEISEEQVLKAINLAHEEIKKLCQFQHDLLAQLPERKTKIEVVEPDHSELFSELKSAVGDRMSGIWGPMEKHVRSSVEDEIRSSSIETVMEKHLATNPEMSDSEQGALKKTLKGLFKEILKEFVRGETLARNERLDGRASDTVRDISCEVGILPRAHGSALFTRGETQSLGTCTLGTTRQDEQIVDLMLEEGRRRFMLHYNFPPYSVGEAGRIGPPKRREIGHGNLASTALQPLLPDADEFPYIIRVVSEILESNGSSSMASVCSCALAMMDAGVPLKKAVAGIAMGLIEQDGKSMVLSDIAGYEDFLGDMDFKVAGTADGITAFQLDTKTSGISEELMGQAMAQAKQARILILDKMNETLSTHRERLSQYAPIIETFTIEPEKIGAVIGPGGKTIRKILTETEAQIDIEDDGTVKISGANMDVVNAARSQVEDLVQEIEIGQEFKAKVTRIEKFGAFVEIKPGVQGLVHVSDLSDQYVKDVEDIVKIGDEIEVVVNEIDSMGRVNLKSKIERPEINIGDQFPGKVNGVAEYGAFVEFNSGQSGLVHISTLSDDGSVEKVEDVINVGDEVTVEVTKIDDKGRFSLKIVPGGGENGANSSES